MNKNEVLFNYTGFTDYFNFMPREFAEIYIKRRVKKGIKIRIIAPYSDAASEFKKRAQQELRACLKTSHNYIRIKGYEEHISFRSNRL